ncbi:flagellar motor protein MotS [Pseudogracilibacillus auburnensis]|uniref:Chemotaxis protein MotB n=1 Tax=Pseudogracilibacillus auburnensis TaxID=1494959 RepID=A0A2V3VI15_9BACI|nr:flagellar motor protein MotS [Pseudogracilibacillus auburnensis]MBO1003303.1 flagellar motor protein MotB [Pseudogracilibacillus auburnensis]PXW80844.1 chemotaxis protein MotB [Pseudogracilibacillus auburnensis]
MRRRNRKQQKNGAPKWMVTYSDMVTLVLVFFILLFSMSQIDLVKFESISKSFQSRAILDFLPSSVPSENITNDDAFGGLGDGDEGVDDAAGGEDDSEDEEELDVDKLIDHLEEWEKKADALAKLMENIDSFLDSEELGDVISAKRTEEGVILVLQDSILFDSAEAQILDTGRPFLDEVGNLLKGMNNHVRVEGHTDNRPISTYRYPSNWELSGARAGSVVRYFIEEHDLDEERFLIGGYGDTRPVVENKTPEDWSKNRRVEIVILDADHEQTSKKPED